MICYFKNGILGFLPSPVFERNIFIKLEGETAVAYAFKNIYHTYYLCGILFSMLVRKFPVFSICKKVQDFKYPSKEIIANLRKVSQRIFEYGNTTKDSSTFENWKKFSSETKIAKSIEESFAAHLIDVPQLGYFCSNGHVTKQELNQVVYNSLLIKYVKMDNLKKLSQLLCEMVEFNIAPSNIFLEAANYLARQELFPYGIKESTTETDAVLHEDLKFQLQLKIAACLTKVADYLSVEPADCLGVES